MKSSSEQGFAKPPILQSARNTSQTNVPTSARGHSPSAPLQAAPIASSQSASRLASPRVRSPSPPIQNILSSSSLLTPRSAIALNRISTDQVEQGTPILPAPNMPAQSS